MSQAIVSSKCNKMSVKYKTANVEYSLNSLVHFMRLTWFSSILRIQMTEENEPRCFKM